MLYSLFAERLRNVKMPPLLNPLPQAAGSDALVHGIIVRAVLLAIAENSEHTLPTLDQIAEVTYWDVATCKPAMAALIHSGIVMTKDGSREFVINGELVFYLAYVHAEHERQEQINAKLSQESNRRAKLGDVPTGWVSSNWRTGERPLPAPGVYVIFGDAVPVYIGSSVSILNRIRSYRLRLIQDLVRTPWGNYRELTIKAAYSKTDMDWLTREARLIARLKPIGNTRVLSRRKENATAKA